MDALALVDGWSPETVAVAAIRAEGEVGSSGPRGHVFRWASVAKLLLAYCCLIAAEEGTLDLDEQAGPPASTVRHLLAHASGLPFDGRSPVSRPGERRVYSNTGYELLADHLAARAEMPYAEYLRAAVVEPLGLRATLRGSPASGVSGTLDDLIRFARELLAPRLIASETLAEATAVQFPGLSGVLPDFGRQERNDWGLGFELRDAKSPHWTGSRNSPRTFGHFGGAGTFVWVDPDAGVALACLTDRPFDEWADEAKRVWPALSDAVLAEAG